MITDTDIKKLKKDFVTKKDLQQSTDEIIKVTTEMIGGVIERFDKRFDQLSEKLDTNLDEVNNHERRIRRLEDKVLINSKITL